MTVENAILGNPSIFISNKYHFLQRDILKKYDLLYMYIDTENNQLEAIEKGIELLTIPDLHEEWQKRKDKMLEDKIDVTAFLVWFVENYPESFRIMKRNKDFQFKFKLQNGVKSFNIEPTS